MTTKRKSADLKEHANQRFAWLLEQRGFNFWTEEHLEEKIRVMGTRPDFYVETEQFGPFLAEVESFEESSPWPTASAGRFGQFDPEISVRRIRTSVRHAARQLKPYRSLQIPMIIILDNWRKVGIPSNVGFLRQALFGTVEFRVRIKIGDEIRAEEPALHHGAGQTLHPERKMYVSAIGWNFPNSISRYVDTDDEKQMCVRMVHNDFAQRKLPIEVFSDKEDEHYGYDENGRWQRLP